MTLGPFAVDFINVAHSIPESNALAIRTPAGIVLHTGDWKIDPTPLIGAPTDQAKLTALGDEGVLALIGDSTNAVREGRSPSEVRRRRARSPSSSAPRRAASRSPPLPPMSAASARLPTPRAPPTARWSSSAAPWSGSPRWRARPAISTACRISAARESYGYLPPDKVLALCTGSQGEPRAALSRIAEDEHPEVTLAKGDRVIFSSRAIPGQREGGRRGSSTAWSRRASRSSPTAPIWSTSPAIHAAPNCST